MWMLARVDRWRVGALVPTYVPMTCRLEGHRSVFAIVSYHAPSSAPVIESLRHRIISCAIFRSSHRESSPSYHIMRHLPLQSSRVFAIVSYHAPSSAPVIESLRHRIISCAIFRSSHRESSPSYHIMRHLPLQSSRVFAIVSYHAPSSAPVIESLRHRIISCAIFRSSHRESSPSYHIMRHLPLQSSRVFAIVSYHAPSSAPVIESLRHRIISCAIFRSSHRESSPSYHIMRHLPLQSHHVEVSVHGIHQHCMSSSSSRGEGSAFIVCLQTCSSDRLLTFPNHYNRIYVTLSDIFAIPTDHPLYSFLFCLFVSPTHTPKHIISFTYRSYMRAHMESDLLFLIPGCIII